MNNPVNRTDATGAWPEFIKNAAKWVTQNIAKPITETAKSIWSKRHENIVVGGLTGSASFGAGITGSAGLATVGAEYVCFSDSVTNELRSGVTISMGIGAPVPLEMHGFVGNTWAVNLFNIFSPFDNLYDKIMEW